MSNLRIVHVDLQTGKTVLKKFPNGNPNASAFVNKAGDTMTGPLTLSGSPTNNNHAANKQYVDQKFFSHDQVTPSSSWLITHNKNTNKFIAQVYINNELVYPEGIVIVDNNNIIVNINETTTGFVNIIFGN